MIPIQEKSSATAHVTLINMFYATTYFFYMPLGNQLTCYVTFHIFSDILINKHNYYSWVYRIIWLDVKTTLMRQNKTDALYINIKNKK